MGNSESNENAEAPKNKSDSWKQEFAALDGGSRVLTLMDMVRLCTYPQQLEFVEELQNFLHKDFLTHLPSDLSGRITSYLSIEDVLNCLLVCKSWNHILGDCTEYWQTFAKNIGLTDLFVKEKWQKYGGLKSLCISALGHRKYVQSLVSRAIVLARSPDDSGCSYVYAGHGIALRYEEVNSNSHSVVIIERMNTPHSMVQVASFAMSAYSSRVKWAAASDNYVLWKQLDGKWNGCSTNSAGELDTWDDDPVSQAFHSITFCHKCRLIAIMCEAEDDCEVWDLQVVKLVRGKTAPRKMVYPIPLEQIQKVGVIKKRHFPGGEVTLLSEVPQKKAGRGFCQSHRLLLQVDGCIAIHTLEAMDTDHMMLIHHLLPDSKLSKPLHVFRPSNDEALTMDIMDVSSREPPSFCLSSNCKLVGVVQECYLYVWNVDTYQEESRADLIDLNLPNDTQCIALGSVYTILASNSWGTCAVVATRTGELLVQGKLPESTFNPSAYRSSRYTFHPPLRQDWLSGFDYFDFWPLSLVFDHYAKRDKPSFEHELQAVVGVRSHQRRPTTLHGML